MFEVRANGKKIQIENFKLSDSMEQFVAQYEITFFNKTLLNDFLSDPNTKIEIFFNGEKIKTCYIDKVQENKTTTGSVMSIVGRGSLCDLVDSSVYYQAFNNKIQYIDLIKKMVNPFKIKVIDNVGVNGVLDKVQFQYEDSTFDAINKHSKNFNVILDEDKDGNLVINKRSQVIHGRYTENDFASIQYVKNFTSLYSNYVVVSNGEQPKKGTAKDNAIRFRLKTKEVEVANDVNKVAEHIKEVRKTQSETISISDIRGFQFKDDSIIKTNALIRITTERIDSTYMVTGFSVEQNPEGISTSLTIKRRDSYNPGGDKKDIL